MRKSGYLVLIIAIICLMASCGNKSTTKPGSSGGSDVSQPSEEEVQSQSPSKADTLTIQAYYTDDNIMNIQQKSLEIEVTSSQSKYEGAFKALQLEEDGLISLWEKAFLNSLSFSEDNGQLTIDIGLPAEANLGSGGEALAIEALKQTMFQFDEVKQIELTLDGQQVESLMGHVELEHPMVRS